MSWASWSLLARRLTFYGLVITFWFPPNIFNILPYTTHTYTLPYEKGGAKGGGAEKKRMPGMHECLAKKEVKIQEGR